MSKGRDMQYLAWGQVSPPRGDHGRNCTHKKRPGLIEWRPKFDGIMARVQVSPLHSNFPRPCRNIATAVRVPYMPGGCNRGYLTQHKGPTPVSIIRSVTRRGSSQSNRTRNNYVRKLVHKQMGVLLLLQHKTAAIKCWAKIIFDGKLRNPSFCHLLGKERPFFFFIGRY